MSERCFNPYNIEKHPLSNPVQLRKVNENLLRQLNIAIDSNSLQQQICNTCRLRSSSSRPGIKNVDKGENDEIKLVRITRLAYNSKIVNRYITPFFNELCCIVYRSQ